MCSPKSQDTYQELHPQCRKGIQLGLLRPRLIVNHGRQRVIMPLTGQDSSSSMRDPFMLNEQREVDAAERDQEMPMVGMNGSSGIFTAVNGQSRSGPWSARSQDEDDEELDADENSELNRHRRSEGIERDQHTRQNNGIDSNGDRGENGHHVGDLDNEDEKSFKYYKELPDYTKLYNAKRRSPGFKAIGAGLVILTGLGYLIAYLCTSVSCLCRTRVERPRNPA